MRFSILLFGLYQFIRIASRVKPSLRKEIRNISLKLLIKTRDNQRGRLLVFDRGTVSSLQGTEHACDVALVFRDRSVGYAVLSDRGKDAVFNAAVRGDIHIEGMSVWAMWFEQLIRKII